MRMSGIQFRCKFNIYIFDTPTHIIDTIQNTRRLCVHGTHTQAAEQYYLAKYRGAQTSCRWTRAMLIITENQSAWACRAFDKLHLIVPIVHLLHCFIGWLNSYKYAQTHAPAQGTAFNTSKWSTNKNPRDSLNLRLMEHQCPIVF